MKKILSLLLAFCISYTFVEGAANRNDLDVQFHTKKEIESSADLAQSNKFDPGHHKIFLKLKDATDEKKVTFSMKRPAIGMDKLTKQMNFNPDEVPNGYLQMSSKGFFPGEKIHIQLSTMSGKESHLVDFVPNPLYYKSEVDGAMVCVYLISAESSMYFIDMINFEPGERYEFISKSGGETMRDMRNHNKFEKTQYMPAVVGMKGGVSQVSIKRKSGETISFSIPWGNELALHKSGMKPPAMEDPHDFFYKISTR